MTSKLLLLLGFFTYEDKKVGSNANHHVQDARMVTAYMNHIFDLPRAQGQGRGRLDEIGEDTVDSAQACAKLRACLGRRAAKGQ